MIVLGWADLLICHSIDGLMVWVRKPFPIWFGLRISSNLSTEYWYGWTMRCKKGTPLLQSSCFSPLFYVVSDGTVSGSEHFDGTVCVMSWADQLMGSGEVHVNYCSGDLHIGCLAKGGSRRASASLGDQHGSWVLERWKEDGWRLGNMFIQLDVRFESDTYIHTHMRFLQNLR